MPQFMEQKAGCRGSQHSILRDRFGEKQKIFDTPIDIAYLQQVQRAVAELACEVINTVTYMGWPFPGFRGPGISVWPSKGGAAG